MSRRRIYLTHRKQRSILTDMLPFEVPPTFSNRGFYRFLRDHNVDIENGELRWVCDDTSIDKLMALLFGIKTGVVIAVKAAKEWGGTKTLRAASISYCRMDIAASYFSIKQKIQPNQTQFWAKTLKGT